MIEIERGCAYFDTPSLKYLKNKIFIHIRERPARRLGDAEYQLLTELV